MKRKAIRAAQARARLLGLGEADDQAHDAGQPVAIEGGAATPPPPGIKLEHGSPTPPRDLRSQVDPELERARRELWRVRRVGETRVGYRERVGSLVSGGRVSKAGLSRAEKNALRAEKQRSARMERRRYMEEAGRLALGRRRLGLPAVDSEYVGAGYEVPVGGVPELSSPPKSREEMKGLLAVVRQDRGLRGQDYLQYEPNDADRGWVAGARACGATVEAIAEMLLIPLERFVVLFPLELNITPATAVVAAGTKLLERALVDGDVGALRYYLLTHGGSEWQGPSAGRLAAQFGRGSDGSSVTTFVIEGFGSSGLDIEAETLNIEDDAISRRSER